MEAALGLYLPFLSPQFGEEGGREQEHKGQQVHQRQEHKGHQVQRRQGGEEAAEEANSTLLRAYLLLVLSQQRNNDRALPPCTPHSSLPATHSLPSGPCNAAPPHPLQALAGSKRPLLPPSSPLPHPEIRPKKVSRFSAEELSGAGARGPPPSRQHQEPRNCAQRPVQNGSVASATLGNPLWDFRPPLRGRTEPLDGCAPSLPLPACGSAAPAADAVWREGSLALCALEELLGLNSAVGRCQTGSLPLDSAALGNGAGHVEAASQRKAPPHLHSAARRSQGGTLAFDAAVMRKGSTEFGASVRRSKQESLTPPVGRGGRYPGDHAGCSPRGQGVNQRPRVASMGPQRLTDQSFVEPPEQDVASGSSVSLPPLSSAADYTLDELIALIDKPQGMGGTEGPEESSGSTTESGTT